jgi:hypothetical protein
MEPNTIPDMKIMGRCLDETQFCSSCCNHYIGADHGEKREACNERCEDRMHNILLTRPKSQAGFKVHIPVTRKVEPEED